MRPMTLDPAMLALHRLVHRSRLRCSLGFRLRVRIVPALRLFVAWSPAYPAFASKLDRDLALGVALSTLLALATFSSTLRLRHSVDDTLLVHVLLGAKDLPDLHKHFVVRVKAVGVEHKVVGKVTVFLIGGAGSSVCSSTSARTPEEELPVPPVVSGTEIDVVETLIGILRDLQQLVVPGVDGAKVRFHLQ